MSVPVPWRPHPGPARQRFDYSRVAASLHFPVMQGLLTQTISRRLLIGTRDVKVRRVARYRMTPRLCAFRRPRKLLVVLPTGRSKSVTSESFDGLEQLCGSTNPNCGGSVRPTRGGQVQRMFCSSSTMDWGPTNKGTRPSNGELGCLR